MKNQEQQTGDCVDCKKCVLVCPTGIDIRNGVQMDCVGCTACIDACPTEAIVAPYVVDGSKCISYFTIELKENLPQEMKGKFDDWMFGCDVCQDVCPWNRFSKPHNEPLFEANPDILNFSKSDWEEITVDAFQKVFKNSAVKRTKYEGLLRNINFLKK